MAGKPVLKKYFKGEVIFKEGAKDDFACIIKSGSVEIYAYNKDQRVTLATLKTGSVFGEMAAITGEPRTAYASAATYVEIIKVDKSSFDALLAKLNPLIKSIMNSLINRITTMTKNLTAHASGVDPVLAMSYLLELHGSIKASHNGQSADTVNLNIIEMSRHIRDVLGFDTAATRGVFEEMQKAGLLQMSGRGDDRALDIDYKNLAANTKKLLDASGSSLVPSMQKISETLESDQFAELVGLEEEKIIKKIKVGDFPWQIFKGFDRAIAHDLLDTKGKKWFEEAMKRAELWELFEDLEFVDDDTIKKVVSKMESIPVAKMSQKIDEEQFARFETSFMPRKWKEVKEFSGALDPVPDEEMDELEKDFMATLKAAALAPDEPEGEEGDGDEEAAEE